MKSDCFLVAAEIIVSKSDTCQPGLVLFILWHHQEYPLIMQSFQIMLLIIMTDLVLRVKVFLNELKKTHDRKFPDRLPSASIAVGESRAEDAIYYETVKDDRAVLREFHNNATKPTFRIPECQCNLTNHVSSCLASNKIPFNEVEIECECGEIMQFPALKKLHEKGMEEADVHQSLIDRHLDCLFTSKLSVPLIDKLGCGGCVCTGILK